MPRRPRPRLGLLALLPSLLLTGAVTAGTMHLSPTRVELAPDRRIGSVTVRNDGAEPLMVQVQTFAWPDSPTTEDLVPTRDLVAVPPVATIPPGGDQLIRVAVRGAVPSNVESTYRLLITEVPTERPDGARAGVQFALRFSVPVFVTPPGVAAVPAWSLERTAGAGPPRLVLANSGTAHIQVWRIRVSAAGQAGAPTQVVEKPAYVLPGQRHAWTLPRDARGPLSIKAETHLGEIEATIPPPGG